MTSVKIYVGTYRKYNEGSLFGKWFDLNDYSNFNELKDAMFKLHKDEEDPEFMFQDYECSEAIEDLGLISESYLSNDIYNIIETIKNCCYDEDVIESFINSIGTYDTIEEIIEKVEESYSGEYSSDIKFVQELLESTGDIPKNLPNYIHIDWESTARDIMYDYSTGNNHYFRNI
jgi:antirestriction protein